MDFARAAVFVRGDTTPCLRGQVGGGLLDERIRAVANGDNHRFHRHIKFAASLGDRTATTALIRLAQFHFHAGHGAHKAVFIAQNRLRIRQHAEVDAFLLGVVDFFLTSRHFRLAAAIDDRNVCTQTTCATRRVHRDVAAADDSHAAADLHRRIMLRECVGTHQVNTSQEFIGGIHAAQAFARNALEIRQTGTRTDEHRIVAFIQQLLYRHGAANNRVGDDFHAQFADVVNFLLHQRLGQTEFRNAVHQHAAGRMERLVHRHVPTSTSQIRRAGQTGRARTHDSRFFTRGGSRLSRDGSFRHGIIRSEAFQTTDGHRFALDAAHALAFALRLLWTHAATDGRETIL